MFDWDNHWRTLSNHLRTIWITLLRIFSLFTGFFVTYSQSLGFSFPHTIKGNATVREKCRTFHSPVQNINIKYRKNEIVHYYKGIKNGRFKAFSQSSVITNRTSINDQGLASNIVRVYPTPRIPQSRTVNRLSPSLLGELRL